MVKRVFKDLLISLVIAFMTFYIMYLIKGSILTSDLYNQGIDFLEYFKDHLNILSKDWIYNWNIALGDNMYALVIYYLLSPFNILLKLFKNVPIIVLLPIFMTIKMMFMSYFASLYFKKVTSKDFRWIGTIIYISSYYIIVYGNYQIMWLDTFVFFPLLLLAIEKVILEDKKLFYIISLFIFISSDYYLAAILIPHIAIYAIIRFIILKGKKEIFKFIFEMIKISLVGVLLSSFVLIPAISLMLNSAKEVGNTIQFKYNLNNIISFFTDNYIGNILSPSNTNITLIGMLVFIPWFSFGKDKSKKIYYFHILLLLIALFSDKVSYILNLAYIPAGGNYRYNLFLNIYIALILFEVIKEIIDNKRLKTAIFIMTLVDISLLFINFQEKSKKVILINLLFIVVYCLILLLTNINKRKITFILTVLILFELTSNLYYIFKPRNEIQNEVRIRYSNVLQYMKDNYGKESRVEIKDTDWSWNIYLASNIAGVSGYHSLINGSYKEMSDVFGTTNKDEIRNEFKGRNIISNLVGTDYYLTEYKYCPYRNSELIDEAFGYYIYIIDNEDFKFYPLNKLITGNLPASIIEKDNMLYGYLYLNDNINSEIQNLSELDLEKSNIFLEDIKSNEITINKAGDYYIKIPKEQGILINNASFRINGNSLGKSTTFPNLRSEELECIEIYIGYLNLGDTLEVDDKLINNSQIVCINEEYIQENDNSEYINIKNIEKSNTGLISTIELKENGFVFLPIAYDENWKIKVNNEYVEYYKVNGGFIGLEINKGINNIEMIYSFKIMYIGIALSLVTILGIIIYVRKGKRWI